MFESEESRAERERLKALPFRMPIHDIFMIKGRGICIIGTVETGTLRKDEAITITGYGKSISTKVIAFEGFIKDPDNWVAELGDATAILVKSIEVNDVQVGMVVTTEN